MIALTKKKKEQYIRTLEDGVGQHSQWADVLRRLTRDKLAMIGLFIVLLVVVCAVFAPLVTRWDYTAQSYPDRFLFPSSEHIFGTDNLGRDLFARIIYGGRVSLLVAVASVAMSTVIGGFLGLVAGYYGGVLETVILRIMDILMAVPAMLLAVALSAAMGGGIFNTALACAFAGIPSSVRILRASVLSIRSQEYVEAAQVTGSKDFRVIFRHILPNCLSPLIVDTTLRISTSIMAISGLSFVGLGIQPPTPEWGSILASSRDYIRDFWPLVVFPGLFIMLTMFGFNVLGDGLRDALDPKLKQ